MSNVLPWSYSSLSAFETCPKRFYLTRIAKVVKEPQSEAMLWGNKVHKALENAVAGIEQLPHAFKQYGPIVTRIRAANGRKFTEQKFGLSKNLKPVDFFAKEVWFRGVIDLNIVQTKTATTLDYKTGKPKEDHDQLKLFAATTFAQHPYLERVKTGYLWLANDKVTSLDFKKDDVPVIWQEFLPRVRRMEIAQEKNEWTPRPSGLCRKHCPVGRSLCEFCGKD